VSTVTGRLLKKMNFNTILIHLFGVVEHALSEKRGILIQKFPFLSTHAQWPSLIEKRNLDAALCCDYLCLLETDSDRLPYLIALERCMQNEKAKLSIITWCLRHPKQYESWCLYKKRLSSTVNYAFEERFLKTQEHACARLASAWAWNAASSKCVPITSCTLFPPDILFVNENKPLPYAWFTIVSPTLLNVVSIILVQHDVVVLHLHIYNTPSHFAEQKADDQCIIPTYVLTLWHDHPGKTKTPWDDPLPQLLCTEFTQLNETVEHFNCLQEVGLWFSAMITSMLKRNPKHIILITTENDTARYTQFVRKHFNTKRVIVRAQNGEKEKNVQKTNDDETDYNAWILDGGHWFSQATQCIVTWTFRAKFGTQPQQSKIERQSLHDKWSSNDSTRVCLTTALFGIRAREANKSQKDSCKSVDRYLDLAKKLLDWDVAMYIYVEPAYIEYVQDQRNRRMLGPKTIVIPLYMEQSRFWPTVRRLQHLYHKQRVPLGFCKEKDTALYVFSQASKYDCLERSINMNLFGSLSYYWVDFGIHHVVAPPQHSYERLLQQLGRNQRLRVTYLRGLDAKEITNREAFFSRLQQAVAGGLIGGPKSQVQWLILEFEREFTEALQFYPVLDEAILAAIALSFGERFLAIHSGHVEMFQLRSTMNCFRLISESMMKQDWQRAYDVALELSDDMDPHDTQKKFVAMKEVCSKLYKTTNDAFFKQELNRFT
jgi:hypothetical protein